MKKKKILSIIIPVYNVESFIEQCLTSTSNQSVSAEDIEIIIINDGSTDKSIELVEQFIRNNNNFEYRLYSQTNKGLSAARNAGLDYAKGQYVWFIDSDDWIRPNCLHEIIYVLNNKKIEVLALTTIIIDNQNRKIISRHLSDNDIIDGERIFNTSWKYPYSGAQFYIFNKDFLNRYKLRFKEGLVFEDLLFTPHVLDKCRVACVLNSPSYYYRLRSNSITTSSISQKKADDLLYTMNQYIQGFHHNLFTNPSIPTKMSLSIMTTLLRKYVNHLPKDDSKIILKKISNNAELKQIIDLKNTSLKYKLAYWIAVRLPFLCGK